MNRIWLIEHLWLLLPLAIILALLIKPLLWRIFRFDKRVADILSQKKSSEVKLGKLTETLAPLLNEFPVDLSAPGSSTAFLGQPVDYVHFEPDGSVVFIEVKSADSQLSAAQKRIKNAIEAGKVRWEFLRVR